jgi:hypothetical protein
MTADETGGSGQQNTTGFPGALRYVLRFFYDCLRLKAPTETCGRILGEQTGINEHRFPELLFSRIAVPSKGNSRAAPECRPANDR